MVQSHRQLRRGSLVAATALGLILSALPALLPAVGLDTTPQARAATMNPVLRLLNARTVDFQNTPEVDLTAGAPVPPDTTYTWILNKEDVGNSGEPNNPNAPLSPSGACTPPSNGGSDASYPDNCNWPSVRSPQGWVPIATSGDDTEWNSTTGLDLTPVVSDPDLGPGRYLVSVLADGYKVGGAHITLTPQGVSGPVDVSLQPWPLPLGTIRVKVFSDEAPVDGMWEAGAEQGLAGFTGVLQDVLGQVSTDWFGNPLCTAYETDAQGRVKFDDEGAPIVDGSVLARCVSDADGDIVIPNLGPNRYGVTVSPPNSSWGQTTTLEGAKDFDVWVQEGDSGYDTELVVGGEVQPAIQFGFVRSNVNTLASAGAPGASGVGTVTGRARKGFTYIGGQGGVVVPGEPGTAGMKAGPAISRPWVTLSDQANGDAMVYSTRGSTDGTFRISGVPAGTYFLSVWDEPIDHLLYSFAITVTGGQTTDVGDVLLAGWFTEIDGYVFVDTNANGVKDPGEQGIPGTTVTLRERDNTLMDQFTNTVTTNSNGYYRIREAYPLTRWLVLEHFNTRYEATGVTVQAENDPAPTTYVGAAVDISVLPVIGLSGRVDWGVKPYAPGTNGGIAGTVNYDTMRNELNPRDSVAEDYQPGIPNVPVVLYGIEYDEDPLSPTYGEEKLDSRGLPIKHPVPLAETYTSETFVPPKGCTARDWKGDPLTDQKVLPEFGLFAARTCVEASITGWTAGAPEYDAVDATTAENWGQTVAGNYGFAESELNLYLPDPNDPESPDCAPGNEANCTDGKLNLYASLADNGNDPQPLVRGDYIVGVEIPDDARGKPMYKSSQEEDINVFEGDAFLPQANFPPSGTTGTGGGGVVQAGEPAAPPSQTPGTTFDCVGPDHTVDSSGNPTFVDGNAGGSPFEGQDRPLCTERLVNLRGQQAVAPTFLMFTPTPLPTHFWGLMINDLGLTWDKTSTTYGEAQGIPHAPVGLYDFGGQLVDTVTTDFNGYYEALEPSTHNYNCPTPAGLCAGMYRFVGNDPGQPGAPNENYDPRYRTIAANFQAFPGLFDVTDTAPTAVASTILTPGSATPTPVNCTVASSTPQLLAVNTPVLTPAASQASRRLVMTGRDFKVRSSNLTTGSRVELVAPDGTVAYAWTQGSGDPWPSFVGWSDTQITVDLPVPGTTNAPAAGAYQLRIRNSASGGSWTVNGLTIHVLGTGYSPGVVTVDNTDAPGAGTPDTVQAGVDQANAGDIVVVRPGAATAFNPRGWYRENVVLAKEVTIQGVGPGGLGAGGAYVRGSGIDAGDFNADGDNGAAWYQRVFTDLGYEESTVPDGAAVTVLGAGSLGNPNDDFGNRPGVARLDGLTVTGGYQQNIRGNINAVTGAVNTPLGADGARVSQGGGLYVHSDAEGLRIANNIVIGNGGSYAGGLRVGTPYVDGGTNNHDLRILYNRFRDNGGTNLAGGVGVFSGSDGYEFAYNDLCGNFSQEYGGGLTHYGYSPNASVHDNRVWFNTSYDEGGGIMVAGELPATPDLPSDGSGNVSLEANLVTLNLSNDDGGGIRLLQVGWNDVDIVNNAITNNVSAHEGGGIALDDAPTVRIINNTIARNLTTATAITSTGDPAPAGLSTSFLSAPLLSVRPGDYDGPLYSDPEVRNNAFFDNRAGYRDTTDSIVGISAADANRWDMGSTDGSGPLHPRTGTMSRLNFDSQTVHQPTWYVGSCPNCTMPGTDVRRPGSGNSGQGLDSASGTYVTPIGTGASGGGQLRFRNALDISVEVQYNRTVPFFRQIILVAQNLPPEQQGDFHFTSTQSLMYNLGRAGWNDLPDTFAPIVDFDNQFRWNTINTPTACRYLVDAGFDEWPSTNEPTGVCIP